MSGFCSSPSQPRWTISGLLLLPLGTVRPLDRMIRQNDADRIPGREATHRGVAGELGGAERSLIVLELELRPVLRNRHRLARPRTRRRLRLAAIGASKIGSDALLGLRMRQTRKGRGRKRDDESQSG